MTCKECDENVLFVSLCKQHWEVYWTTSSVEILNNNAELLDVITSIIGPWDATAGGSFYVTSCCGRLFIGTELSTKCGTCGKTPVSKVFDKSTKRFLKKE